MIKGYPEPNYTLGDLHNKYLTDGKFSRLYNEWVRSGYQKQYKPTLDRIDCKKPYSLDNIHPLSWAENRYKQRWELKRTRARKVFMLKGDNVVKEFNSVTEAVRKTGLHQGNISSCLSGKRKTTGGYKFSYENPNLLKEEK